MQGELNPYVADDGHHRYKGRNWTKIGSLSHKTALLIPHGFEALIPHAAQDRCARLMAGFMAVFTGDSWPSPP